MFSKRIFAHLSGAAALLLAFAAPSHASDEIRSDGYQLPEPAIALLDLLEVDPSFVDPELSPDGTKMAFTRLAPESDEEYQLTVVDFAAEGGPAIRTQNLGDRIPQRTSWASNERILVVLEFRPRAGRFNRRFVDELPDLFRTVSFAADLSSEPVILFSNVSQETRRANWNIANIVDFLPDDPDHILMPARNIYGELDLWRVNVLTGAAETHENGTPRTRAWYTDNGVAVVRIDVSDRGRFSVYSRARADADWRRTLDLRPRDIEEQQGEIDFEWAGRTDQPGQIFVRARAEDSDFIGIHRFDLETGEFLETVAIRDDYDISAVLVDYDGEYFGYGYVSDRPIYHFEDESFAPHYNGLVSFFGDQIFVSPHSFGGDRMIVRASGPTELGSYYLYNFDAANIDPLFPIWPESLEVATRPVETFNYTARDGLQIQSFITWPAAGPGEDTPLILMPHGGPEARDQIGFDRIAQFLSSLGYAVLQPNFRGSFGYGRAFVEAGHRNWGTGMQTDLVDGVEQLIEAGRIDANQVCIVGFSYGAYAAMMGAINNADLYRCAVAGGGVFDLAGLIEFKGDRYGEAAREYWIEQLGDPQDSDQLAAMEAISPLQLAEQVGIPVLLLHGTEDVVVNVGQSRDMANALERAGKPHVYVEEEGGRHNWGRGRENFRMTMRNLASFLDDAMDGSIDRFAPEIPAYVEEEDD